MEMSAKIGFLGLFLVGVFGADTRCQEAASVLQGWYNSKSGTWNTTGWWNSANCLNAIIDYTARSKDTAYVNDIANTYSAAGPSFLNDYYDDEGWWALAWINAYDYTGQLQYLNLAKSIFNDMSGGWDSTCGGGIWWSKDKTYKNAIANELFFEVATHLHLRTSGDTTYLNWATREWQWFEGTGMINSQSLINDGLNSSCQNNGETTWTYNQGVILGGLADLAKATGNATLITRAQSIANATLSHLTSNGILKEPCEPNCGGDGPQFKGIFMRHLYYLNNNGGSVSSYVPFLQNNANSIWNSDRSNSNQLGLMWMGPFDSADASRQSSAMDTLNSVCFG